MITLHTQPNFVVTEVHDMIRSLLATYPAFYSEVEVSNILDRSVAWTRLVLRDLAASRGEAYEKQVAVQETKEVVGASSGRVRKHGRKDFLDSLDFRGFGSQASELPGWQREAA